MDDLVSVIVPYFNNQETIRETLISLQQQTYKNLEIIIVDDHSKLPFSINVQKEFTNLNIKVLQNKKKGASAARNFGFENSLGKFIQYLDADDIINEEKIAIQHFQLKNKSIGTIAIADWGVFNNYNEISAPPLSILSQDWSVEDYLYNLNGKFSRLMPIHSYLIPRGLVKESGGWDERISLGDDGEFMNRVIAISDRLVYTKGAEVFYRRGNNKSLSHSIDILAAHSSFLCVKNFEILIEQNFPHSLKLKKAVHFKYSNFYHWCIDQYPNLANEAKTLLKVKHNKNILAIGSKKSIFFQNLIGINNYKRLMALKKLL